MNSTNPSHDINALRLRAPKTNRRAALLHSLLCASVALCTATATAAPESWAQSYGSRSFDANGAPTTDYAYGSGFDFVSGIAPMPDGGVVVAGQLDLPELYNNVYITHTGSYSDAAIVRYAKNGNIIWQQLLRQDNDRSASPSNPYRQPSPSHVYRVQTDAQGNVFICGGKGNPDNSGQIPFVAKFNAAGALVWQNGVPTSRYQTGSNPDQFVDTGVVQFTSMGQTKDGGVVVGTEEYNPGNAHTVPVLIKFNANGSLGFHTAFQHAGQYLGAAAVAQSRTDANSYLTVMPLGGNGITAVRTNGNGNITAQRSLSSDGRADQPISALGTADGGFVILSQQGSFGNYGIILRKLNANLQPVFEKVIQRTNTDTFFANDIAPTSDGGFLVSGSTVAQQAGSPGYGQNGTDAAMMKLSAAGQLQFVSVLGGPRNEGSTNAQGQPGTSTHAAATADGGYALATASYSYQADNFDAKTDWWTAKTNSARKVKNFDGVMADLPLAWFSVTNTNSASDTTPRFTRISPDAVTAITTTMPGFIIEDLAKNEGIDKPDVIFQGSSSPRIVSSDTAEAIVGQHFSYHILTAFVSPGANLTYSATGLPDNFVLDPKTGVISGAPKPGSETTTPIVITLTVHDGAETGTAILNLTIGDGVPSFAVNGSGQPAFPGPTATPVDGLADTVLSFTARYPGRAAGQWIRVQSTTTPNNAGSWKDLDTGTDGYMTLDPEGGVYVLNSTNYPGQNGIYFRSLVAADARKDAIANVVGPFNLASSKARAGRTLFSIIPNGRRADFDFRASELSTRTDLTLRVQSSTSPEDEGSWANIADGNSGAMTPDTQNKKRYSLTTNNLPPQTGIFFRAVASSAGAVDSLSNIIGPYTISAEAPPVVTITSPPHPSPNLSLAAPVEGQDRDHPLVLKAKSSGTAFIKISAKAVGKTAIKSFRIYFDSVPIESVTGGSSEISINYQTTVLGPHVIQAVAVDEFGATARGGTAPLYITIKSSTAKAIASGVMATAEASGPSHQYRVVNSNGAWNDPGTWRDEQNHPGTPGPDDYAYVNSSTVRLSELFTNDAAVLVIEDGGHIVGPGTLVVHNFANIFGGSLDSGVHFTIAPEASVNLSSNRKNFRIDGVLENQGELTVLSDLGINGSFDFINKGSMIFLGPVVCPPLVIPAERPLDPPTVSANTVENLGRIAAEYVPDASALVDMNGGNIVSGGAGNIVSGGAGNLLANGASTLITNNGAAPIVSGGAGNIVSGGAGNIVSGGAGNIVAGGAGNIVSPTENDAAQQSEEASFANAATGSSAFTQNGGEADLTGISVAGSITLNGGVLSGSGLAIGSLTNRSGYITPGNSPGALMVTGNFTQLTATTQQPGGTLVVDAAGGEVGQFDELRVGGTAQLGGALVVQTTNGYVPLPGDPFSPLGYGSVTGSFASVTGNVQVAIKPSGVLATLKPDAPNPPAPKLLNISTRMDVQPGENALIAGFYVSGPKSKTVLIRAIGPSLAERGIAGPLDNPTLTLDNNDAANRKFNDDWKSGTPENIPAGFAPSDERESVIVATLAPGFHTAIVNGKEDHTGVAIVEVYDLEGSAPEALLNISTRGLVQTGDKVMIAGFFVGGNQPASVLLRAIGPSLKASNIAGALMDPELELHDANGSTISNRNWRDTQEAEIAATGVPPSDDRESALLANLVPGPYTAIVRGEGNTTGVALVEAYSLN